MYKKIYLEITNNCNLSCDFCIKNNRVKKYMSRQEFYIILDKIKFYTKYLYFHVLGEPLLHPLINDFIDYASKDFNINITTNGYLLDRIIDNKNIRQINISLHSYDKKYGISIKKYMNNIFNCVEKLKKKTYISYRIWVKSNYIIEILNLISDYYNIDINIEKNKNIRINSNIYLNIDNEFVWPDFKNNFYIENGTCYALKDHIGILCDGTVIPCCLDSKGIINLGDIFKDNMEDIINSDKYQNMLKGFKCNKKVEELCKKCDFIK